MRYLTVRARILFIVLLFILVMRPGAPASLSAARDLEDSGFNQLEGFAEGLKLDVLKLAGNDSRLGELEAYKLLERMGKEKRRPPGPYRQFLSAVLDPAHFGDRKVNSAPARSVAALRITGAITLEIRGDSADPAGFDDILLPLLGVGSQVLRNSVVKAVSALVEQEKRKGPQVSESGTKGKKVSTLQRLCEIVEHNPPPAPALLEDVSKILWESDGKRFLSHVIAGMILNQERNPDSTPLYLKELRSRLRLGFPTPKGWSLWWKQQQSRSLPDIFIEVQKKLSQDNASNWKASLKRFRETGDYVRLLAEMQATLQSAYTLEHRVVAVEALGDFAGWLRGAIFPGANVAEQEKLRFDLQSRACEHLLKIIKGEDGAEYEQPEVRRQALISLRHFQSFLSESAAGMRREISEFTIERSQRLLEMRPEVSESPDYLAWRAEMLELVRAAGAFKIPGAKKSLDSILHSREFLSDLELQSESIQALGYLLKGSLDLVSASLFMERFRETPALVATDALKLRLACAEALNARPEDGTVLALLRTFHAELLKKSADVRLQMPAIAGLSTLAQGKDPEALETLLGVLASPGRYDTQVLVAVIDAISYVGNREALDEFLPLLKLAGGNQAREKAIDDHLMKRVQGLIKAEGIEGLAWALDRLERRAYQEDNPEYLSSSLRLLEEPGLQALLLPRTSENLPAGERLGPAWLATLAALRAAEVMDSFDGSSALYKKMAEFLGRQPQVGEGFPRGLREFQNRLRQQDLRHKINVQIAAGEGLDVQRLLDLFIALALADGFSAEKEPESSASAKSYARWSALKWVEVLLASGQVSAGSKRKALYTAWINYLAAEDNSGFWKDMPAKHRDSGLKRLESLRSRKPSAEGE